MFSTTNQTLVLPICPYEQDVQKNEIRQLVGAFSLDLDMALNRSLILYVKINVINPKIQTITLSRTERVIIKKFSLINAVNKTY